VAVVLLRHRSLIRAAIAAKVPATAIDDVESVVFARFSAKVYSVHEITKPVRHLEFLRAERYVLEGVAKDAASEVEVHPVLRVMRPALTNAVHFGQQEAKCIASHGVANLQPRADRGVTVAGSREVAHAAAVTQYV
jgi:hypothetical protein